MGCCRTNTLKQQQCEPQNQRKPYHQKSGSRNSDKKASLQTLIIFQLQRHFRKVPLKQKWNASLHVEIFRKNTIPAPLEGVVFDQLVRSNLKLPLQPHFTGAFTIPRRDGNETVKNNNNSNNSWPLHLTKVMCNWLPISQTTVTTVSCMLCPCRSLIDYCLYPYLF